MNASRESVLIVGVGSIGGVIATHLIREDVDVWLATTNQEVKSAFVTGTVTANGKPLGVKFPSERVLTKPSETTTSFDWILLAVQPTEIEVVAPELSSILKPNGRVLCLPNGLCEERLAAQLGEERVIGAVVLFGARMDGPGKYVRTSRGGFRIGTLSGRLDPEMKRVQRLLAAIGPVITTNNLRGARFSKLVVNSFVSTLGTIGGTTVGDLLRRRIVRELALAILEEGVRVAQAEGVKLEPIIAMNLEYLAGTAGPPGRVKNGLRHALLFLVGRRYRRLRSSMLAAIERGRPPSVDFLNGEIVERARRAGIEVPFNQAAQAVVWSIAKGEMTSGPMALQRLQQLAKELQRNSP